MFEEEGVIVKRGIWLYDGQVETDIIIKKCSVLYGSGDYQVPPEIQNDQNIENYTILYGTPGKKWIICAGGGQYLTLPEAIERVEQIVGKTVKWLD